MNRTEEEQLIRNNINYWIKERIMLINEYNRLTMIYNENKINVRSQKDYLEAKNRQTKLEKLNEKIIILTNRIARVGIDSCGGHHILLSTKHVTPDCEYLICLCLGCDCTILVSKEEFKTRRKYIINSEVNPETLKELFMAMKEQYGTDYDTIIEKMKIATPLLASEQKRKSK